MASENDFRYDDRIIQIPKLDYNPDPKGLGHALYAPFLKYKTNIAQIDGLTLEEDTYDSLLQRTVQTASWLKSKGVTSDDIIVIASVKVAPLDPTITFRDMLPLIKQVQPKFIFVQVESIDLLERVTHTVSKDSELIVFGETLKHIPFSTLLTSNHQEENFKPYEVKSIWDTAIILFSSGTSGLPKGICLNHYALLNQMNNLISFGYNMGILLGFTGIYWITSVIFLACTITTGSTRVLVPRLDPSSIWKTIQSTKPTFMLAAPHLYALIPEHKEPIDTSFLKQAGIGGAPVTKQHILHIQKILPKTQICPGYGQTEVSLLIACFKPSMPEEYKLFDKKPTSAGSGVPGISYKIVDPETEEILGPNQPGELRLKTDLQLNGYHNMDSTDVWDSDGWLRTGDIVYYDDDRCFFVVDRLKEVLKFRSHHVPPATIELVLKSHPDIEHAVVVGVPHEVDGDHPAAVVVVRNNKITAEEIERFANERVDDDRNKLRGGVVIVDRIPVTATGKIQRRALKDLFVR